LKLDYPITVVSDLHVGHPASYIGSADELAPLFQDAATVVFNGDTAEMLWLGNRDHAQEQVESISRVCLAKGARPIFLNGNHDPVISSASYLDLAGGSILVTHGDILFHEIAPWSREAPIIGNAHTQVLREMHPDAHTDLSERLVAVKRASLALEMHEPRRRDRSLTARLATIIREGWPPWRVLQIVRFWMQTPRRADELAEVYRPQARFVFIGHTHHAGVWRRGQRVIVNTGSFLPLSGRYGVRIEPGRFEVRRIVRGQGEWVFDDVVASFDLGDTPSLSGKTSGTEAG